MTVFNQNYMDPFQVLHEYGVHVPTRTMLLEAEVDEEGNEVGVNYAMYCIFAKNLHFLESLGSEPILVRMNTGGGDVNQGMAIYDLIKASPCEITVQGEGQVCSMGTIILQAADRRTLLPNTTVMFHSGSAGGGGDSNVHEKKRSAAFDEAYYKRVDDLLYQRMVEGAAKAGVSPMTKETFWKECIKSRWLTAEEAVTLGIADGIVE